MNCIKCQSENIYEDNAQAEISCNACGYVWELETVAHEEFQDVGGGRKQRVGTNVNINKSRAMTLYRAESKMNEIILRLDIPQKVVQKSLKIYVNALNNYLHKGVKASLLMGACVYISARLSNLPITMLDVSDKLSESIFQLGKVYNRIKMKLQIELSDTDPCVLIERFVHELDLKIDVESTEVSEKEKFLKSEVQKSALGIVKRFKKDWLSTGRNPRGVAATAALMAARMHGFDRDYEDVARIGGINAKTIRKRLREFLATPSADISIAEFRETELEDEANPPSFLSVDNSKTLEISLDENQEDLEAEFIEMLTQIDSLVEDPEQIKYGKLLESEVLSKVGLTSEQLIELVADDYEFLTTDNEELMGRVDTMRQCIASQPNIDENEGELENEEELENDEDQDVNANNNKNELEDDVGVTGPCKILVSEPDTFYMDAPNLYTDEQVDETIESDIITDNKESYKILKWFFKQKENRTFFRRKKTKKETRKRKQIESGNKSSLISHKRIRNKKNWCEQVIENHNRELEDLKSSQKESGQSHETETAPNMNPFKSEVTPLYQSDYDAHTKTYENNDSGDDADDNNVMHTGDLAAKDEDFYLEDQEFSDEYDM